MSKLFDISTEERERILEMHNSKPTINEQSFDQLKSYGRNLIGQVPTWFSELKSMNPKPEVLTSNFLQRGLGSSAEMLGWTKGENILTVHPDGKVEIAIGLMGDQKKGVDAATNVLKSLGLASAWKSGHEGEKYTEIEGLDKNKIMAIIKSSSKFLG